MQLPCLARTALAHSLALRAPVSRAYVAARPGQARLSSQAATRPRGGGGVRTAVSDSAEELASEPPAPARSSAEEPAAATFASLGVAPSLVTFLASQGLNQPTGVQARGAAGVQAAAIPLLLTGKNAAIQAQTGSGKTLTYLLPFLTSVLAEEGPALCGSARRKNDAVLGIVVAPSQELAIQIVRTAEALLGPAARHLVCQAIGGANMKRQLEALKRDRPVLVVGTPGRLAELSLLGHLRTHHVRTLVLDEADELLDRVYGRHLARLAEHTGRAVFAGRQTLLVSATLTPRTLAAYAPWCAQPQLVRVTGREGEEGYRAPEESEDPDDPGPPPALPAHLQHVFVSVTDSRMRVDLLRRSIHALDAQRALVFLNWGRRLADCAAKLAARGMAVGALHGGMSKAERGGTLAAFRAGKLRALLVTDLAARGLDVPECDAVFNLELPSDGVHYAHRAGRTARAGRPGRVVTLVEPKEHFVLRKFEKALSVQIQEANVGGGEFRNVSDINNAILNAKPASKAPAAYHPR